MPKDADKSAAAGLGRGAVWMMLATIVPAIAQWLAAVLVARQFGAASLGEWVLAASIATPVILMMQMPLRTLFVVSTDSRSNFDDYLTLRFAAVSVAVVLATLLGKLLIEDGSVRTLVVVLALARGCEAMSDVLYAPLQREGRMASIAFLTACRVTIGQAGFVVGMLLSHDILVGAWVLVISNLCAMLGVELPSALAVRRKLRSGEDAGSRARAVTRLALAAAPLSVAQALTTVSGNIPRYVVQWWGGAAALGLYAVLEHLTLPVSLVTNSIGQSSSAGLARQWNTSEFGMFQHVAWKFVQLNILVGLGFLSVAFMVGPNIIQFVYGHAFQASREVIGCMMLASTIAAVASSAGYILTSAGIHRQQMVVMSSAVACNLAVGTAAAACVGWPGAILGIMAGCAVQSAMSFSLLRTNVPNTASATQ